MLALTLVELKSEGYEAKICELWRTKEKQTEYVKKGLSKTMNSMHLHGLAADIALFKNGNLTEKPEDYRQMGETWESLGGRWGGRFGVDSSDYGNKIGWDPMHLEVQYDHKPDS